MIAMLEAASMAINSAKQGNTVASSGDVTVGSCKTGRHIVISVSGLRGCVLVKATVLPEECNE